MIKTEIRTGMTAEYLKKLLDYGRHVAMKGSKYGLWRVAVSYEPSEGFQRTEASDDIISCYKEGSSKFHYSDFWPGECFTREYIICKPPVKERKVGDRCELLGKGNGTIIREACDIGAVVIECDTGDTHVCHYEHVIPLPDNLGDKYITVEYKGKRIRAKIVS